MLTIAEHIGLMQHALGATPDARHSLYQTFNRAGRFLFNYHRWSWRVKNAALTTVISTEAVPLPTDFQEEISLLVPGTGPGVRLIDLPTYHKIKKGEIVGLVGYVMCIPPSHTFDGTTGAMTARNGLLYPLAPSNGSPELDLWYYCGWTDVSSSDDAKYPRIAPEAEEALVMLARAGAVHIQNQVYAFEDAAANAVLERLKMTDSSKQQEQGRMRGGASDRMAYRRRGPTANWTVTI